MSGLITMCSDDKYALLTVLLLKRPCWIVLLELVFGNLGCFNFWQCLGLGGRVDRRLYERGRAEATPIIKIPIVRFVSSFFFWKWLEQESIFASWKSPLLCYPQYLFVQKGCSVEKLIWNFPTVSECSP